MMRVSRTLRGAVVAALLSQVCAAQAQQSQPAKGNPPASAVAQPAPPAVQPAPPVLGPPPQSSPIEAAAPSAPVQAAPQDVGRPSAIGQLHDLSPWSMFMSADWLVKAVIVGLIFASLGTWTILIAKTAQLFRARRQLGDNLSRIADSRSLGEAQLALGSMDSVLVALLTAATQEIRMSADAGSEGGIKERAASRFSEITRPRSHAFRRQNVSHHAKVTHWRPSFGTGSLPMPSFQAIREVAPSRSVCEGLIQSIGRTRTTA